MTTPKIARNEALGLLYRLQSWYRADENKVELVLGRTTYNENQHEVTQALYKLRVAGAAVVTNLTDNPQETITIEVSFPTSDQSDPLFDQSVLEDDDMSLCEYENEGDEYTPVDVWTESPNDPVVEDENGGRQSALKVDWTLIPYDALLYVAQVLTAGAEKYGKDNWKLLPPSDHAKHRIHHAIAATHLIDNDLETEERIVHLSHEICRALFEIHSLTNP